MNECINEYYILNEEKINTKYFDDRYLKEGKALYEVIRIINGVPLYLEEHLERLKNTAKLTNDKLWLDLNEVTKSIFKLIDINDIKYGNIKMVFNFNKCNNFLVYFVEHHYPTEDMYLNGVKTIFYHGERKNPNAKVIDVNFRKGAQDEIKKHNAFEAILVDRNGFITEGSKSNIFMIKGDDVLTSPLKDVLPGVTRAKIIDLCIKNNINILEKQVKYTDIDKLDAAFISGTSPKVLPIKFINDFELNSTKNKILNIIKQEYDKDIKLYINKKLNIINKDY